MLYIDPKNSKLRLEYINWLTEHKQYKKAIKVVTQGISIDTTNADLLYKKAQLLTDIEKYDQAVFALDQLFEVHRDESRGLKLLAYIKRVDKHNVRGLNMLAVYYAPTNVDDLNTFWTYAGLLYQRKTTFGSFLFYYNYTNRNANGGEEYMVVGYPKMPGDAYAHFVASTSNSKLYPYAIYSFEYFIPFATYEISGGGQYMRILQTHLNILTGSIYKYLGKWLIIFRPKFFIPSTGSEDLLLTLSIRRYFNTPDSYLSLALFGGRSPDLSDFASVGFINLNTMGVNLTARIALGDGWFAHVGVTFSKETFPNKRVRDKVALISALGVRF